MRRNRVPVCVEWLSPGGATRLRCRGSALQALLALSAASPQTAPRTRASVGQVGWRALVVPTARAPPEAPLRERSIVTRRRRRGASRVLVRTQTSERTTQNVSYELITRTRARVDVRVMTPRQRDRIRPRASPRARARTSLAGPSGGSYATGCFAIAATSFMGLLMGRVLQGLGAAGPYVLAVTIVRDQYEGSKMAQTMSLIMTVFIAVPMIAPFVGQGLLMVSGWRSIFQVLGVLVGFLRR